MLTGAGGSIGSALAKALVSFHPRLLVLLDRSKHHLHRTHLELADDPRHVPHVAIVGSVCDGRLLAEIFGRYRPDLVYHAAAFKHVPLMETDPIAAAHNNAIGTCVLARIAVQYEAARLIMISTDKAVNPHSVMGVSKRIAELVLLRWSSPNNQMKAVRLGNVFASRDSVVPHFLEQISRGGPVTVTDPKVNRYFLTMGDAVALVLAAASLEGGGGVFIPVLDEPVTILDLAKHLIQRAGLVAGAEIPIVFTGLRPGDKMAEEFVSARESVEPTTESSLCRVSSPGMAPDELDAAMTQLEESVHRRDLPALVDVLGRMVPEYRPSETLLSLLNRASA